MQVNPLYLKDTGNPLEVRLELACHEAELDEQWSFVGNKSNQRWLWYAVDHATNTVLAYVFGKRMDIVFQDLKALLAPFNICRYFTGYTSTTIYSRDRTSCCSSGITYRHIFQNASAT